MSKNIFKEKQRFSGWEVIALIAFFIVGLTYRLISQHWIAPVAEPMSFLTYFAFIIPLAASLWYLINMQLSVKVTKKSICVKYSPLSTKTHKIKWKDVEECEFLSSVPTTRNSGWDVNFGHEKRYSLSGRRGVHLRTKQGEDIIIGTRNLKGLKQAIEQVL
ncbi:MAG TPA: hypothetical protein ENJ95_20550 [Bacteroidetes bacterium]|nr:hypothetical protein [Bacteroidota bacterium]